MSPSDPLESLDAVALAEHIATGALHPREVLDATERRFDALNPGLRAAVALDFEAARARVAGGVSGPLAGVPLLVKDLLPYPGLRCAFGSRLFAGFIAPAGSPFTERLDAAGLVTVGKSAASEFGLLGSTETLLEGRTHNPWGPTLSAAGSSGGAAAAVAAGLVPVAHANDAGGSIRVPASVTGLFGFKPSRGRTAPTAPPTGAPFERLLSEGCISRSVRDTVAFLTAVSAEPGAFDLAPGAGPERLRIGVLSPTLMGGAAEPLVARALDDAAALCASLGHDVTPASPPLIDGPALSAAFFHLAGHALGGLVGMMTPLLGRPPGPEELEPFTLAVIARAQAAGPDALAAAVHALDTAAAAYRAALAPFDVLLSPTLATPPWELGWLAPTLDADTLIARTERAVGYTPIHNVVGGPAMSVPLHFTTDGVPIGLHFAARPGDDTRLLALAFALERARPWAARRPPAAGVKRAAF
jgi:amidase